MFERFVRWLKKKRFCLIRRHKVFTWTCDGKKYLAIIETDWRGVRSKRRFEVVDELGPDFTPIAFPGKEAIKS